MDNVNGQGNDAEMNSNSLNKKKRNMMALCKFVVIQTDTCGICHHPLKEMCSHCRLELGTHFKVLTLMCPEIRGACNHAFHLHCLG